jgi:PHD/YefM family antitoxin component YafN of YafNO toxin-antitoxin module
MIRVSATEFLKNFSQYKEAVQREPVEVLSHGEASGYFISAAEFAELERLRRRQVYRVAELPNDILEELANVRIDPRHDHLNALLDEDSPNAN